MKTPVPEFSRPIEVDRIPNLGSTEKIAAEPAECEALARRLQVPAVHAVNAKVQLKPWRGGLQATGTVDVELTQVSVVSLEAFRDKKQFKIERYFLPASAEVDSEADVDRLTGLTIDIGEVVSETLGLELDPYPRKPGEEFKGYDSADDIEAGANPFASLVKFVPKTPK